MQASARQDLDWTWRGEPTGPAASRQPHQHGFRHIVLLMTKPDHTGMLLQELHSRRTCFRFARACPRAGPGAGNKVEAQFPRDPAAEREIGP